MKEFIYDITPVPKPRMPNKMKFSPMAQKYWEYKDLVRLLKIDIPVEGAHVLFKIPMPKSWTNQKKKRMCGRPHQNRGDVDNYLKGLLDAVYQDDKVVWDIRVTKLWSDKGQIVVR